MDSLTKAKQLRTYYRTFVDQVSVILGRSKRNDVSGTVKVHDSTAYSEVGSSITKISVMASYTQNHHYRSSTDTKVIRDAVFGENLAEVIEEMMPEILEAVASRIHVKAVAAFRVAETELEQAKKALENMRNEDAKESSDGAFKP